MVDYESRLPFYTTVHFPLHTDERSTFVPVDDPLFQGPFSGWGNTLKQFPFTIANQIQKRLCVIVADREITETPGHLSELSLAPSDWKLRELIMRLFAVCALLA